MDHDSDELAPPKGSGSRKQVFEMSGTQSGTGTHSSPTRSLISTQDWWAPAFLHICCNTCLSAVVWSVIAAGIALASAGLAFRELLLNSRWLLRLLAAGA